MKRFALAAILGLLLAVPTVMAAPPEKVGICHATGSESNPYVFIVIAEPAVEAAHIDRETGNLHGDHLGNMDFYAESEDECLSTSPSPSPTMSEAPTPTPSVVPSMTPTPSATPTETATATPSPTVPSPSPAPTAPDTTPDTPKPTIAGRGTVTMPDTAMEGK